eukprot:TRINITY_DN21053_c0_g1_i1.p1 TRINITY_DN21053_c0_g1~~TRINITY_DN21053_c0_g1_i1.p1  ORF type:complete len:302 (-),score=33.16 TRINITY_DN21053_c0_g1_i1:1086-1991(-)
MTSLFLDCALIVAKSEVVRPQLSMDMGKSRIVRMETDGGFSSRDYCQLASCSSSFTRSQCEFKPFLGCRRASSKSPAAVASTSQQRFVANSLLRQESRNGRKGEVKDNVREGDYLSRKEFLFSALSATIASGALSLGYAPETAARERGRPKNIAIEDYKTADNGLKYFDFEEGKGETVEPGTAVSVHFECIYRTLTVVSSRESKLLGGNRIIAQPYDFVVGSKPGIERRRDAVDAANGLFSAQAAPKPPKALYTLTEGMKVGGKRTVIVTPAEGYGEKGFAEIPPGATFDLNIELLEIKKG